QEALFRLSELGDLVHRKLRRGELKRELEAKAQETWLAPEGPSHGGHDRRQGDFSRRRSWRARLDGERRRALNDAGP
ncbi:MAG: hypothetical protein L0170_20285, partial [Acidobacteria bacterium]|nr:hypothetical protein [Acidobacteriota bacterium]